MKDRLRNAIKELAKDLQICKMLNEEERDVFADHLELVSFSKGERVFEEGVPGDYAGVVVSGKFEAKKRTEFEKRHIVIALLEKGAFVGELSLLDGQPRSATITALEDSELLILNRNSLQKIEEAYPYVAIAFLKAVNQILSIRLRKAVDRVVEIF